ncbi:glycerophosphodiester phosphodiesterase family protein [Corynebacterium suicordis]
MSQLQKLHSQAGWRKKFAATLTATTFTLAGGFFAAGSTAQAADGSLPADPFGSSFGSSFGSEFGSSFDAALGSSAQPEERGFDLQSHRGGRGEWTEESAYAFEQSLKLDVTTLELDIVLAEDNTPLVWHDPSIQADKCSDTEPATPNDPEFPYVGKLVHELNWAQLQTLTCDKVLAGFPNAAPVDGNKLIQLQTVFDIAKPDPAVRFNIETKIEAEKREDSATPQEFVDTIVPIIQKNGAVDRSAIQSFDWRSLPLARAAAPGLDIVALYDETTWVPNSVWTGSVDYVAVDGDLVKAAQQLDVDVLSPNYRLVTKENVAKAQEAGLQVIPWTVNSEADINQIIDTGVDGLITDYPTRASKILKDRGITVA